MKKITDWMFSLVNQCTRTNNGSDKRKQMTKSRGHTEGSCDFFNFISIDLSVSSPPPPIKIVDDNMQDQHCSYIAGYD